MFMNTISKKRKSNEKANVPKKNTINDLMSAQNKLI